MGNTRLPGSGGHDLLTQADAGGRIPTYHTRLWAIACTASQAPLAAKRPDGRWFKPDAVLQVSNGVLDLGVAAVAGLQFQGLSVPVGDEAVITVGGEDGQLGTGRRLHPPDDEPHRRGVRLGLEGGLGGFGHIGPVHPVRNRRPGIFGYRLDEIVQTLALADGDGAADIHPAADGDHGVGMKPLPARTVSCPLAPA